MRKIGWVLACALLVAAGVRAQAQVEELGGRWDVRAGFFVPEREAARAAEGDLWFTIGAEKPVYQMERYTGTISIDYYGSGKVYNIPILLNARGQTNRLRYGIGLGIGISHDLEEGKTGFDYQLGVGYDLTRGATPITFDVRYLFHSTGGGQLNGWAFTFGYTF